MWKQTMLLAAVVLSGCGGAAEPKTADATPVRMGETIELQKPAPGKGASIDEALQNRRSWREYSADPLSLSELSGVMWASAGINREDGHLTAPSALGLYPIRVYAFFREGVYRYDARAHALERVAEGDHRQVTAMQDFAYGAPLNLAYVADTKVYEGRDIPAGHIRYLCGQDAAGYAENVNLYTAGHSLRSITRGSFREGEILRLLGLDSTRYFVALAQTVGK